MTTAAWAVTSGRAPVNGIQLFYGIRGDGDPLVMLYGALYSMENFGGNLDALARHRRVGAVDLRAHGRSSDGDGPLTLEVMADDIAGLLNHLKLGKADVLGYSLGGGVAVHIGLRHPERWARIPK
jgi:pimeloyl-ACP methyl ester carboxylesterase